jgi:spore germination protein GerM
MEPVEKPELKSWRDLLNPLPEAAMVNSTETPKNDPNQDTVLSVPAGEVEVVVFFFDSNINSLIAETVTIEKTEGIARRTMEKLLAGPEDPAHDPIAPRGTRLLDINIKPAEGLCIVDLSREARQATDRHEKEIMVQAVTDTLRQFPAVDEVAILVGGEPLEETKMF